MERLTREVGQANGGQLQPAGGPGGRPDRADVLDDFNGNGTKDTSAADPKVLTYRWNPVDRKLTLTANDCGGTSVTRPVLAVDVGPSTSVSTAACGSTTGRRRTGAPAPTG